jgi:hypothetical protein
VNPAGRTGKGRDGIRFEYSLYRTEVHRKIRAIALSHARRIDNPAELGLALKTLIGVVEHGLVVVLLTRASSPARKARRLSAVPAPRVDAVTALAAGPFRTA